MQAPKILIALAMAFNLALAACTAANPLNDTSWILATLNGGPVLPDTLVTLNFENGSLFGSDGCNSYTTSYTLKGGQIEINKNIATTMVACAEPVMQQATAYLAVLTQTTEYKIEGGQLSLLDANGNPLAVFTALSRELGGTSWIVTGYNNGKQAVVGVIDGSEITANFDANGKLSGSAGCNTYTTTFETSGKTIKIGPAASTRMMCAEPAGVMEQEAQYLMALETAATYRLNGDTLEFRTAEDALAVTFKRAR